MAINLLSEHASFGGKQRFYSHDSRECATEMRFSVFLPPQAEERPVPVLYYLAGLTCTEETFMIKAGAQRVAAELGLMLVAPDTSPRKVRFEGDDASWDFGLGAGFYVDATQEPWSQNYRMYSYVTRELPALVCALRNPTQYRSVSAFAPIAAPMQCPWGTKAFTGYLGSNSARWEQYDATVLVSRQRYTRPILIDQGTADKFLVEQLKPELFEAACQAAGTPLQLRYQQGYDHGYYFIATVVADHLKHHSQQLA